MRYVLLMSEDQPPPARGIALESSAPAAAPSVLSRPSRWVLLAVVGVVGIVLGAGGTLVAQTMLDGSGTGVPEQDGRLSEAYSFCGSPVGTTIADENRTLTIDVKGNDDSYGASYENQACILRALDAPSSVISHLEQTTSIDGRQTETWDGITSAWSYHPDRGSDMVITLDGTDDRNE
ncbi:hypothetical protein GCM10010213_25720 [Microbacterium maritypicum]|uniref:Uncharacterized protein n=2 Tax=Microbacterium maritypicum TaxID=33918 RepID=A0A4Y4BB72_MICMQ|nr:hypothetical protein MLI01_25850 [Microbacterium liquefaciens]GGV61712.1 hypothetical protein GCM10010213_25720 [Microbacterium liquefaciens]